MDWNKTSVSKEKYYNMLTATLIKNDSTTLQALIPVISEPVVVLGMLPYLSLFCSSVEEYYCNNNMPITLKNDSPFEISDIRNKLKLFNGQFGKLQKRILLSDERQNEKFKSDLRFPWTRGLNIHYNLGIFFDKEGHIICNTQYVYYLFQDKSFSKLLQDTDEVRKYGEAMGTVINSVCLGLRNFLPDYKVNILINELKVKYKDYNTNRNFNIFKSLRDGKEVTLRLLHIQSHLNFMRFVVMKATDPNNPWQLRVKYVTLYYAVLSIDKLASNLKNRGKAEIDISNRLSHAISGMDAIFNSEFRNCMMHYGFKNNEKWEIDDQFLDFRIPFFGLIESKFPGYDFQKFSSVLDSNIDRLTDALTILLPINTNGLKDL